MGVWYISSGEHDFIGEFYTDLDEMAEGEGFQIVTWDAINKEKRDKRAKKGEDYENSGTVILKSINIDRVSVIKVHIFREGYKITWLLTVCTVVKSKGKISQNFVAFSKYVYEL